jgi:ABC-type dipeptide/oligopeptide/nickel transport system permease component
MLRFIFTRLSLVVPTFIGITLLVFVLIRLIPGDPIETMAGERGIDPAGTRNCARTTASISRCWCNTASICRGWCMATSAARSSPMSR